MTTPKHKFNIRGHLLAPLFGFIASMASAFCVDAFTSISPSDGPSFDGTLILTVAIAGLLVLAYIFQFTVFVLVFNFLERRNKLNGTTLLNVGLLFIVAVSLFEFFVTSSDKDLNVADLKNYLFLALFVLTYIVPNLVTYYWTYSRLLRTA